MQEDGRTDVLRMWETVGDGVLLAMRSFMSFLGTWSDDISISKRISVEEESRVIN